MIICRTYEPVKKAPALHILMFEIDPEYAAWYLSNAQAFFNLISGAFLVICIGDVDRTRLVHMLAPLSAARDFSPLVPKTL
jgi:hypothetical protein